MFFALAGAYECTPNTGRDHPLTLLDCKSSLVSKCADPMSNPITYAETVDVDVQTAHFGLFGAHVCRRPDELMVLGVDGELGPFLLRAFFS